MLKPITLMAFADMLKNAAVATENPDAKLCAGDHCKFCKARGECPELVKKAQELAATDFKDPTLDLAQLLDLANAVEPMIDAIRARAKADILGGKEVPGWKVVPGRKTRAWKNPTEVAEKFPAEKFPEAWTVPELKTVAQLEKVLKGKDIALEDFIESKVGAPTLAKESDKRSAVTSNGIAAQDFA